MMSGTSAHDLLKSRRAGIRAMLESGFFCLLFLAVEKKYGRATWMSLEKKQGLPVRAAHAL
ncbi:hypothetical protein AX660_00680 [Paraglaciecola hydrolytica]|uniref:Uncharacterized protein n=1 Tax=Paraglaciecola hydrolytica TaxID=1799789 RepID=A0A136A707_9ALTE|nr:hypothetical protein AX660_00680 [Paraglaciecola hydrolytica]